MTCVHVLLLGLRVRCALSFCVFPFILVLTVCLSVLSVCLPTYPCIGSICLHAHVCVLCV